MPEKTKSTINKAFKFRIYPSDEQKRLMMKSFNCNRYVWNHFLLLRISAYERKSGIEFLNSMLSSRSVKPSELDAIIGLEESHFEAVRNQRADKVRRDLGAFKDFVPRVYAAYWRWHEKNGFEQGDPHVPTLFQMSRMLTALKQETMDEDGKRWLYEADAVGLVYVVRDLDTAYQNFFRNVRLKRIVGGPGNPYGYPQYKKRGQGKSYRTAGKGVKIDLESGRVKVPKVGWVKVAFHREIEGRVVSVCFSEDSCGDFYASFACDGVERPESEMTGMEIAIEVGVEHLAVTSDGEMFDKPVNYKKHEKRLAREQARRSRKVGEDKGVQKSNGWLKQNKKVNKISRHIARARQYCIHNITCDLVKRYDIIYIRDVNVKELLKKKKPDERRVPREVEKKRARDLADSSLYEFRRQVVYKGDWRGKQVVLIPSDYPSTQRCSACGFINGKLAGEKGLRIREWDCPECGCHHQRDINSALNLLEEGRRIREALEAFDSEDTAMVT